MMKRLLYLALFCLLSASAWGVTYTTATCGGGTWQTVAAWHDGTSCGHSGAFPVTGDTATINGGLKITCPVSTTCVLGTDSGTALTISANNSEFENDGTFQAEGGVVITHGILSCGADSATQFGRASGAANIYSISTNSITANTGLVRTVGTSAGHPCTFQLTPSTASPSWNFTTTGGWWMNVNLNHAVVTNCGNATTPCMYRVKNLTLNDFYADVNSSDVQAYPLANLDDVQVSNSTFLNGLSTLNPSCSLSIENVGPYTQAAVTTPYHVSNITVYTKETGGYFCPFANKMVIDNSIIMTLIDGFQPHIVGAEGFGITLNHVFRGRADPSVGASMIKPLAYTGFTMNGGGWFGDAQTNSSNKMHGFEDSTTFSDSHNVNDVTINAGSPGTLVLTVAATNNRFVGEKWFVSNLDGACGVQVPNGDYTYKSNTGTTIVLDWTTAINCSITATSSNKGPVFPDYGPNTLNGVYMDGGGLVGGGAADRGNEYLSALPHAIVNSLYIHNFGNVDDGLYTANTEGIALHNTIDTPTSGFAQTTTFDIENNAGAFKYAGIGLNAINRAVAGYAPYAGTTAATRQHYELLNIAGAGCTIGVTSNVVTVDNCTNSISTALFPASPGVTFYGLTHPSNVWLNGITLHSKPGWTSTGVTGPLVGGLTHADYSPVTETTGNLVAGYGYDFNLISNQQVPGSNGYGTWNNPAVPSHGSIVMDGTWGLRGGAGCTSAAGTTTTNITCTTLPTGTAVNDGIQIGGTANLPTTAIITGVNTGVSPQVVTVGANNIGGTGLPAATGAGVSVLIYYPIQNGCNYGGVGCGSGEVYNIDPQYRCTGGTVQQWDTNNGGPGTATDAVQHMVGLNGRDYQGNIITFDQKWSITSLESYLDSCWMAMNLQVKSSPDDTNYGRQGKVYSASVNASQ